MLRLLIVFALLLCGCGNLSDKLSGSAVLQNGQVSGNVTFETPLGNITISSLGIRGELSFLVTVVDFSDQANAMSDADAAEALSRIDAFLTRQTTGTVTVKGRVQRVTLGSTSDYTAEGYPEGVTDTKLQRDARAAAPGPEKFKLFLTPATPVLATGGGFIDGSGGEAFVSVWTAWQNLPIPHEIGHMLGLPHSNAGIMKPGDLAAQSDWNGSLR